jgi:hypothetical protein
MIGLAPSLVLGSRSGSSRWPPRCGPGFSWPACSWYGASCRKVRGVSGLAYEAGLMRLSLRCVGLDLLLDGARIRSTRSMISARRPPASRPSAASSCSAMARSSAARPTRSVEVCQGVSSCPAVRTAAAGAERPAGLLRTCRTDRSFRDAAGLSAMTVPPVSGPPRNIGGPFPELG